MLEQVRAFFLNAFFWKQCLSVTSSLTLPAQIKLMSVHFLTTVAGRKDRTSYVCVIVCVSVCVKHKYQIQNQIFILFIYLFF